MNKIGLRIIVSGIVQGVFFRASTKNIAHNFHVTGWAKNLPDGTVEVCAFGDEDKVHQLKEWLKDGPKNSRVSKIESQVIEFQEYPDFLVR